MQPKESKSNWHFWTSIAKSLVRVGAGIALCFGLLPTTGILLMIAEILGIVEEL
jgi:hypothetical protein